MIWDFFRNRGDFAVVLIMHFGRFINYSTESRSKTLIEVREEYEQNN